MTVTAKECIILAEVAKRRLKIERFGGAWRVYGPDVDILAATIEAIQLVDLRCARRISVPTQRARNS